MTYHINNWFWIPTDTNPTTHVYSTAANAFVLNSAAAFLTWLADTSIGAASGYGLTLDVASAADNGAGKTRVTTSSTANLQTGQYLNFGANGNQQITVINGTQLDLTGLSFASYVSVSFMYGATVIDTAANLYKVINSSATQTYTPSAILAGTIVGTKTLTNPLPTYYQFDHNLDITIILPSAQSPLAAPIGQPLILNNTSSDLANFDKTATIKAQDGTTTIAIMRKGDVLTLSLQANDTANGTWKQSVRNVAQSAGNARGLRANAANNGTTLSLWVKDAVLRTTSGQSLWLPLTNGLTLDISTAGPAALGRDQAGAFAVSELINIYAIWGEGQTASYIAGKAGASGAGGFWTGPVMPTGYTHHCFLFSVTLNTSGNFPGIDLNQNDNARGSLWLPGAARTDVIAGDLSLDGDFESYETVSGSAITSITIAPGKSRALLFLNSLTLTNGANLILPGSANISAVAGDWAIFFRAPNVTPVRCVVYFKADGTALVNAATGSHTALSVWGRSANSAGSPADIAATAATDAVLRESGSTVGWGTVATAGIAADAVTNAKLANMAAGTVKARQTASTGDPEDVTFGLTYGVRGLTGVNNGASPNTKMDITYSEVIVRDTNGFAVRQTGGSFTVDAGASGSALNSRDQSGAFSASQFLHFYAIYGSGQTTGGLVSLTAPTTVTGPTLPSNYTHWAYLFSVYWDASSHLLAVHVRGDEVFYDAQQVALLNGTATTETAVSLTTFVPASAVSFTFTGQSFGATTTAGGALNTFVSLRAVSGTDFTQTLLAGTFGATAAIRVPIGDITMPNHNQQFYYLSTAGTGTSPVASFFLNSYRVPNGGI